MHTGEHMKRYFSISITYFLFSILNVMTFFVLGLITKNTALSQIFSLTYPLQFVVAILTSIFGTASCIRANKEDNKNCVDTGIILGLIFGLVVFGIVGGLVKQYITFMNMSPEVLGKFTIMSIGQLFFTLVINLVTGKLYFANKDRMANLCNIGFILLNFITVTIAAFATSNELVIVLVNLCCLFVYCSVWLGLTIKKFKFDFNILKNLRFDSADLAGSVLMFVIYFVGYSNAFSFGEQYVTALNFVNMFTDPQWDALGAINTIAKVDISQSSYNYKKALKNSAVITMAYMLSSAICFFAFYKLFNVVLTIGLIYLAVQFVDMLMNMPYANLKTFIQLEHSATKSTIINLANHAIRTVLAVVILSPYNTNIAQLVCGLTTLPIFVIIRFKYYKLSKEGFLIPKNKPKESEEKIEV